MRLIGTIMGSSDSKVRNTNMANLLDYGFNTYRMQVEVKKGNEVTKKRISKADNEIVSIVAKEDASILLKAEEDNKDLNYEIKLKNIKLPIKKGTTLGYLELKEGKNTIGKISLTVKEDIKKASVLKLYKRTLKSIISGNM